MARLAREASPAGERERADAGSHVSFALFVCLNVRRRAAWKLPCLAIAMSRSPLVWGVMRSKMSIPWIGVGAIVGLMLVLRECRFGR